MGAGTPGARAPRPGSAQRLGVHRPGVVPDLVASTPSRALRSRRSSLGRENSRDSCGRDDRLHVAVAALGEVGQHVADQDLGHAGARWSRRPCRPPRARPRRSRRRSRPGGRRRAPCSRATSTRRTELEELREPTTIIRSRVGGHLLDRDLAVLGGVADVVARRVLQLRGTARAAGGRSPSSRRPTAWSGTARRPSSGSRTSTLVDVVRAVDERGCAPAPRRRCRRPPRGPRGR